MSYIPYYYRKGDITTRTPLKQSTPDLFNRFSEHIKGNDLFTPYKVIACGSLIQGYQHAKDIDMMLYGELDDDRRIYECLNEIMSFGINTLNVRTDTFFVEDISYLSRTPKHSTSVKYDVYLGYSFEIEIIENKITTLRDFNKEGKVGLLTRAHFIQPSIKSVERGYLPDKHFILN
jgi:hypothetical protein